MQERSNHHMGDSRLNPKINRDLALDMAYAEKPYIDQLAEETGQEERQRLLELAATACRDVLDEYRYILES